MLITPPLALYIHIPWCVRKCPYCDFNSHEQRGPEQHRAYVDALLADLDADLAQFEFARDRPIVSVFFGGGTPSLFAPDLIARILDGCRARLRFIDDAEVTMETNPGTVEHGRFEGYVKAGVNRIAFSSTGSVYGEPDVFPTPETAPFPVQTSLYAASKLAGEGMLSAYAEGYGLRAFIFRFVSVLGERYTHGHVVDFCKQLSEHPGELRVLGDGKQRKSYLYVQDCVDAIFLALEKAEGKVNVFNLGTDEYCEVNDSIGWITAALGLKPKLTYGGGARGWVGDSPFIFLDCARIRALGARPRLTIRQGVEATVRYLQKNPWVYEARALEGKK